MTTEQALQDVEWPTLAFFMGLFVMVDALVNTGVLSALTQSIAGFAGDNLLGFTGLLLWGSGVLSGSRTTSPTSSSRAFNRGILLPAASSRFS